MELNVTQLISTAKTLANMDAKRMARRPEGMSRKAWREKNPINSESLEIRDHAFKTKPVRILQFDLTGHIYNAWIWAGAKLIEKIDLRAPDAEKRLSRYSLRT